MKDFNDLRSELIKIDGRGYKAYKSLEGQYDFNKYILAIDHVQGDPFAAPSKVRIIMDNSIHNIPKELYSKEYGRIAVIDFLTRLFYKNINNLSSRVFGSGKSGLISISKCNQEILDRTSIIIKNNRIEARIEIGFPARGRSVLSKELEKILFDFLPKIIDKSLIYNNIDSQKLINHVKLVQDIEYVREELKKQELIAFIANGSILPRESGVSTKPLKGATKFVSPKDLEITLNLPNKGEIKGMAIKKGITIIVGGGYHGKSTLLRAIELGVYNHIEGDGREFVITDNTALKVRAEDGRVIHNNDISLFINNLPNKKDTSNFSTENASGSTSEAANIIEGIEAGVKTFLIDEDTSATNFMIRDEIMQSLVSSDKEPITPFIEMVRPLYEVLDISTIIVVGSSGQYFNVADTIIQMDEYIAKNVTERARELAKGSFILKENNSIDIKFNRCIKRNMIQKGPKGVKIKGIGVDILSINREDINLRAIEQLVDNEQVNAIGYIMKWADDNVINGSIDLNKIVDEALKYINNNGLIGISNGGNMAMPRKIEIMAAFNRLRNLVI